MKRTFLLVLLLLSGVVAFSQTTNYAVWTAKVKAAGDGYDLIFHVELRPGWHVYALDPGGDGMMIAPSFTFAPGKYTLDGPVKEQGKLIVKAMEGVLGNLRYYENQADFIQHIKASKGTKIEGSYNYQLCSESVCLPPKSETFRLTIP
jgi:thiol:disulfide interchange protein DsbD